MEKSPAWERIRSEEGPDLKIFRARFDYMKNPRNGRTERMIVLESNDSVNVIAITPDDQIVFVRQYRFGIEADTLELPGGLLNNGEDHSLAARRELREETGLTGNHWQYLGAIASNPVFMTSYIHHWMVTEVAQTHELALDDGEEVELVTMPIEEVRRKLFEGYFEHPHTLSALLRFFANA